MDIFQLKCFVSVIDNKSFTDAAYENSVSQSSLSKHIGKLEDELGVTLIERRKRVASLTPAGAEFEPYARRILNEDADARNALKQFKTSGNLHIGSVDHLGSVGLSDPISSFLAQYSGNGVSISMDSGPANSLMDRLVKGELDLAITAHIFSPISKKSNTDNYDLSEYNTYTLVKDEYHVIVSEAHPFASVKDRRISWEELARERLVILDNKHGINAIIRGTFSHAGLTPNIVFECDQVDALLGMAEEGFGAALMSKRVATMSSYHVAAVPMESPITRDTMLVVRKDIESHNWLAGRFVQHIVQSKAGQHGQE